MQVGRCEQEVLTREWRQSRSLPQKSQKSFGWTQGKGKKSKEKKSKLLKLLKTTKTNPAPWSGSDQPEALHLLVPGSALWPLSDPPHMSVLVGSPAFRQELVCMGVDGGLMAGLKHPASVEVVLNRVGGAFARITGIIVASSQEKLILQSRRSVAVAVVCAAR